MSLSNVSAPSFKGCVYLSNNGLYDCTGTSGDKKNSKVIERELQAGKDAGGYYCNTETGYMRLKSENIEGLRPYGIDYYIPQLDKTIFFEFHRAYQPNSAAYNNLISAYAAASKNDVDIYI